MTCKPLVFNVLADQAMPGNDHSGFEGLIFGLRKATIRVTEDGFSGFEGRCGS